MKFVERVRELRLEQQLPLPDFATRLGIDRVSLSKIESPTRNDGQGVSVSLIHRLATAF